MLITTKCAWAECEHQREKLFFELQRKTEQHIDSNNKIAQLEREIVQSKQDVVDMMNSMYDAGKHSSVTSSEGVTTSIASLTSIVLPASLAAKEKGEKTSL